MKRAHVLAVTFLAGLVCGCAVPAHAAINLQCAELTVTINKDVLNVDGKTFIKSGENNFSPIEGGSKVFHTLNFKDPTDAGTYSRWRAIDFVTTEGKTKIFYSDTNHLNETAIQCEKVR